MIKRYAAITAACVIYAAGYTCFLSHNHLAPGGVSGLAVILGEYLPLNHGMIILCLNLPLLAIGAFTFGKDFLLSTLYATVISSLFISLASFLPPSFLPLTQDLLTAGLAGGVLTAVGMGIIFRQSATTGGTDILVRLIQKKIPHIRTGIIFLTVDSCIVALSAIVFGNITSALYAAISLFANTKVFDAILYGTTSQRLLLIVTNHPKEIIDAATNTLHIGITVIETRGGYTDSPNTMLVCAVRKTIFPAVKKIMLETDPSAFLIVTSADEIYGMGFISHRK